MYSLVATPVLYILVLIWMCNLYPKSNLEKHPIATYTIVLGLICINAYGIIKENDRAISQIPEDKQFAKKILGYSDPSNKIVSVVCYQLL